MKKLIKKIIDQNKLNRKKISAKKKIDQKKLLKKNCSLFFFHHQYKQTNIVEKNFFLI